MGINCSNSAILRISAGLQNSLKKAHVLRPNPGKMGAARGCPLDRLSHVFVADGFDIAIGCGFFAPHEQTVERVHIGFGRGHNRIGV